MRQISPQGKISTNECSYIIDPPANPSTGSMNKCDNCQLTPTEAKRSRKNTSLKCLNKFALAQRANKRGLLNWLAGIEGPRGRYVHMHKLSSQPKGRASRSSWRGGGVEQTKDVRNIFIWKIKKQNLFIFKLVGNVETTNRRQTLWLFRLLFLLCLARGRVTETEMGRAIETEDERVTTATGP